MYTLVDRFTSEASEGCHVITNGRCHDVILIAFREDDDERLQAGSVVIIHTIHWLID